MKRLFVFVPAILLVLFLLNSFLLKEKTGFKSTDGGETWQDIPNDTAPFWIKEISRDEHSSISPGKSGLFAWGVNLKKANGTSVWSPIFENFREPRIRSVFETAGGTIFIGNDKGLFKTADDGKTWKHVYTEGLVGNLAESNGVLVAISMTKIIRSTDNGENWTLAISEDSVAFDVKQIKGIFAATTSSSASNTRRLSTSYDGGKTWQLVDTGLHKAVIDSIWRTWNDRPRVKAFITLITQIGENFFCVDRDGLFRSSDKGKTWKLLLPSIDGKVFSLFVSGNVIYAIPSKGGC